MRPLLRSLYVIVWDRSEISMNIDRPSFVRVRHAPAVWRLISSLHWPSHFQAKSNTSLMLLPAISPTKIQTKWSPCSRTLQNLELVYRNFLFFFFFTSQRLHFIKIFPFCFWKSPSQKINQFDLSHFRPMAIFFTGEKIKKMLNKKWLKL